MALSHEERAKRRAAIVDRLRKGVDPADLADEYEISAATIRQYGRDAKVDMARQCVGTRTMEIAAMVCHGFTDGEISKHFGIQRTRVNAVRQECRALLLPIPLQDSHRKPATVLEIISNRKQEE